MQKQLLTEQMFFGVLNSFAIFRGNHLCWSLFLIKLQACNIPVNIAKFLRTAFFTKHFRWLLHKFINFPEKHEWWRRNRFINTTELYRMLYYPSNISWHINHIILTWVISEQLSRRDLERIVFLVNSFKFALDKKQNLKTTSYCSSFTWLSINGFLTNCWNIGKTI